MRSIPTRRVFEEITGGADEIELGKRKVPSRAYVSWFNFKGAAQQRKVGTLSGGERNRVHLAKLLQEGRQPAAARRADQRPRRRHAARRSKRRCSTSPAARWSSATTAGFSTASRRTSSRSKATVEVVWFEGNYQDYEADRHRRLGSAADQPHRIKIPEAHAIAVRQGYRRAR